MSHNNKYLMVTSGIKSASKGVSTFLKSDPSEGTPYSARVRMGHERLVQIQPSLHRNM